MAGRTRGEWRQRRAGGGAAPSRSSIAPSASPASARYLLAPSNRWMIVKRFLTPEERRELLAKALRHFQRGELLPNPSGPARYFAKVDEDPRVYDDALLQRLTRRCEQCLRLERVAHDCVLGRTISLIAPGGYIHRHTDAYREGLPGHRLGLEHCRCNVVVRMPHQSGRPIIEGEALDVEEGDLWVFMASRSFHETQPLQAQDPRIVFGFGWSVPPSHKFQPPPEESLWSAHY